MFVCLRCFDKAFCYVGEADIQDYVPAQNVFPGIFLYSTYYYFYDCGEAEVRTDVPCSAAFV